jgi:DNA replication and repair protein RecF
LYGVHRDDISIKLNGKEARLYASQGQQRSIALSMKLAEGEAARRLSGEYPVYLLDDVLSELDGERQAFLLNMLEDRQIIVTSCDASLFGRSGGASLIHVSDGAVCASPDGTPGRIG